MVCMRALGLRIGLRHIRTSLGLAVVVRSRAMVDVTRRIDPNQTWSTAGRLRQRSGLCRRRSLRRGVGAGVVAGAGAVESATFGASRATGAAAAAGAAAAGADAEYHSFTPWCPRQAPCLLAAVE